MRTDRSPFIHWYRYLTDKQNKAKISVPLSPEKVLSINVFHNPDYRCTVSKIGVTVSKNIHAKFNVKPKRKYFFYKGCETNIDENNAHVEY